jgi:hypothetical protein
MAVFHGEKNQSVEKKKEKKRKNENKRRPCDINEQIFWSCQICAF